MDTINLSKTKIEQARIALPEASRNAIDKVDWKSIVLKMREEKGYSFSQVETLGQQTELLLCGLLNSAEYPKELQKNMGIPSDQVNALVNEMNEKVFKKIREELVKNIENEETKKESNIESRDELLEKIENPSPVRPIIKTPSILEQKLSGSFQIPKVETDHTIINMTKGVNEDKARLPKVDPYRMPIE